MSRFKILVTAPYFIPVVDQWRQTFASHQMDVVVLPVNERAEEEDLLPVIGEIDGVICGDDRFTARVLKQAPKLRVICKWGTGIDSIDQAACQELGIAVKNTPDAFSVPVADSVLGYALAFARSVPMMDAAMKAGIWQKIPGRSLSECCFGVVGVGNVGRRVAERAAAFGCEVLGHDLKSLDPVWCEQVGLTEVPLDELLRRSDFVSLNCDLNPTSLHLISDDALAKMKAGAVLINTARGPIIDEPALIRALQAGRLGGAGLDVFEDEPLPETSPLRTLSNVLLAPHNSNSSPRAWQAVHVNTVKNLIDLLVGAEATRPLEATRSEVS